MKKQTRTKLALRGETIRMLKTANLIGVAGGVQSSCGYACGCPTITQPQSFQLTCTIY